MREKYYKDAKNYYFQKIIVNGNFKFARKNFLTINALEKQFLKKIILKGEMGKNHSRIFPNFDFY